MEPLLKKLMGILGLAFMTQACAVGSLADLTVYDRTEGRRLPVYWHEGRAYVAGKPGNEYQVSVRNRAREDLLAVMAVDGVNVITGQSADPAQSGYVLSPGRALDVQGWRKNLSETAAFYFTALPDSYAARTGRPDNVGVIGVALFRRKQEPQPLAEMAPPASAPRKEQNADAASRSRGAAAESQLGTGHGRRETSYAQYTSFERASAAPAEVVSIYYDSRQNLVARGVVRETAPLGIPSAPRPNPFPGFVPDPSG
jgi:hypothetical protein